MNKMNISQAGIDLIKSFEGFGAKAYKCPAGIWTIGYGHTGDVKEGQTITRDDAEHLLRNDLQRYVVGVDKLVTVPINQNQFDALMSFAYNLGCGALETSDLLKYVNKKDFSHAGKEFARWNKARNPKTKQLEVLSGLTRRREAERQLFVKPVDKPVVTKPAESKTVLWDDSPLVKGQIGRLTILKPIVLWKRNGNKLENVRTLNPGEVYRVYGYDDQHGGQYAVGGGTYVTKMAGYVKYETPSKAMLEKANSL